MPFNWGEFLKIAVPAAVAGTGVVLGNRSANQQNERLEGRTAEMDALAREQMQKQQLYSNLVLPSLLQAMRRNDPALLRSVAGSGGAPPGMSSASSVTAPPPAPTGLMQPGQANSGTFGDIGRGASAGAAIGSIAGPVGSAIGSAGGALVGGVSNLFGKGRRAADPWTQRTQNDFHSKVAGIIDPFDAATAAGMMTPEAQRKAQEDFNRLLAEYEATANQYAGRGKNEKKVIDQMWSQFRQPGYIPDWKKTLGLA